MDVYAWIANLFQVIWNYLYSNGLKWAAVLGILVAGYVIIRIVNHYVGKFFDKVNFERTLEVFIQKTIKVVLWILVIVLMLANLGFDVTALVAGLGIAGFVLGFATKDALSNLAAGLFILVKKPYKLGEEIEVSKVRGIVKEMGIATTTLTNPENHFITVPNAKIWGNPIINYSRLVKKKK